MRKFVAVVAMAGLMSSGCAWLGFGDDESSAQAQAQQVNQEEVQVSEPEAKAPAKKEPAKKAPKKAAKSARKGAKSEAQIKAELDQMAHKLVGQSSRTLLPNKANKEVKKTGSGWTATYMHVNTKDVSTELRPGANGQYVGFIRYQEEIMQCTGATREAALAAPCKKVGARRLNELIRYDGNAWQD